VCRKPRTAHGVCLLQFVEVISARCLVRRASNGFTTKRHSNAPDTTCPFVSADHLVNNKQDVRFAASQPTGNCCPRRPGEDSPRLTASRRRRLHRRRRKRTVAWQSRRESGSFGSFLSLRRPSPPTHRPSSSKPRSAAAQKSRSAAISNPTRIRDRRLHDDGRDTRHGFDQRDAFWLGTRRVEPDNPPQRRDKLL
jgi:hypothetical protein